MQNSGVWAKHVILYSNGIDIKCTSCCNTQGAQIWTHICSGIFLSFPPYHFFMYVHTWNSFFAAFINFQKPMCKCFLHTHVIGSSLIHVRGPKSSEFQPHYDMCYVTWCSIIPMFPVFNNTLLNNTYHYMFLQHFLKMGASSSSGHKAVPQEEKVVDGMSPNDIALQGNFPVFIICAHA